ncbi:MAG: hypothetical protein ACOX1P_16480 [Thermoguttaceae bacterium]|jgi:hypothetical protein
MDTQNTPSPWIAIIQQEPRLAELSHAVAGLAAPTRMPEYGRLWLAILDEVETLTKPLGDEAFRVARDRLHRLYTNSAIRESFLRDEEAAGEFELSNRLDNLSFLRDEEAGEFELSSRLDNLSFPDEEALA